MQRVGQRLLCVLLLVLITNGHALGNLLLGRELEERLPAADFFFRDKVTTGIYG